MDKVTVIEHKGKKIIFQDLSNSRDAKTNIGIFAATQNVIEQEKEKSVLLLTDVTNAHYDIEAADFMKKFSVAVTPYMKASAAVGVSGIKRILLATLLKLTGRDIKLFDSTEQAKDWLVEQ